MESYMNIRSGKLIDICKIFIERRVKNSGDNLQNEKQAERLLRMALIVPEVFLSMTDFCYLCEEVDILKDIDLIKSIET